MELAEIQEFWKNQSSKTDAQKKAFQEALQKRHDRIITLPKLKTIFDTTPKETLQDIFKLLQAEEGMYPQAVANNDVMHKPYVDLRNKLLFYKGYQKDEHGRIIRGKAMLLARKKVLEDKAIDFANRIKNVEMELQQINSDLKGK